MAGDWIKMRMNLRTHPKVVRMASALQADRLRVIGGLHAVWSMADEHTEDGSLPGYTVQALDESISWPGFSEALKDVGWLEVEPQGIVLPRFDTHNGSSAKRRALDADRKSRVRNVSASDADEMRTREEKRREEVGVGVKDLSSKDSSSSNTVGKNGRDWSDEAKRVLMFLNAKTGHAYEPVRANLELIVGRLKEGTSEEDCRAVIAAKCREWATTDKATYLRPATLFAARNFAQYKGQLKQAPGGVE